MKIRYLCVLVICSGLLGMKDRQKLWPAPLIIPVNPAGMKPMVKVDLPLKPTDEDLTRCVKGFIADPQNAKRSLLQLRNMHMDMRCDFPSLMIRHGDLDLMIMKLRERRAREFILECTRNYAEFRRAMGEGFTFEMNCIEVDAWRCSRAFGIPLSKSQEAALRQFSRYVKRHEREESIKTFFSELRQKIYKCWRLEGSAGGQP